MDGLEIKLITPDIESQLTEFFITIEQQKLSLHFHPHSFTAEEAHKRATYQGKDLYYILQSSGKLVIGYGMLRGWDEGYAIPSLGIIIHPNYQGSGLGRLFMEFLHCAARLRGATKIRLRVYPENTIAHHLYEKLGYVFEDKLIDNQILGFKTLI